jgi:hypothetical protein
MSVYETKTVRVHLPDHGRYVYCLLTRFDGEDHLLADEGWRSEYIRYGILSRNADTEDAVTGDPFAFIRQNEWLRDTAVEDLFKGLDMERIDFDELADEQKLTPEDIEALATPEAEA